MAAFVGNLGGDVEMGDTHRRQGASGLSSDKRGCATFPDSRILALTPESLNHLVMTIVREIMRRQIRLDSKNAKGSIRTVQGVNSL